MPSTALVCKYEIGNVYIHLLNRAPDKVDSDENKRFLLLSFFSGETIHWNHRDPSLEYLNMNIDWDPLSEPPL